MPECHFCKKIVCTNCSNRETPGSGGGSSKVRVCHVCKVNKMNRETDEIGELVIGKPKDFQKVIGVKHDNKTGLYTGLPMIWRDLLDMPLDYSTKEVNTADWDPSIAPV